VEGEVKDILYDLASRFQEKGDLVGAKNVYRALFAADINFRDVKEKFELLAGSTSDPMVFEKTAIINDLSESARRRYILEDELGRLLGQVGRPDPPDDRPGDREQQQGQAPLPDHLQDPSRAGRRPLRLWAGSTVVHRRPSRERGVAPPSLYAADHRSVAPTRARGSPSLEEPPLDTTLADADPHGAQAARAPALVGRAGSVPVHADVDLAALEHDAQPGSSGRWRAHAITTAPWSWT